jgi:hypothetical protein
MRFIPLFALMFVGFTHQSMTFPTENGATHDTSAAVTRSLSKS